MWESAPYVLFYEIPSYDVRNAQVCPPFPFFLGLRSVSCVSNQNLRNGYFSQRGGRGLTKICGGDTTFARGGNLGLLPLAPLEERWVFGTLIVCSWGEWG